MDIFERVKKQRGNIGQYAKEAHGYFAFPKLEGEIGPRMMFRGKEVLNWSLNNYIGLANDPEVRKVDAEAHPSKFIFLSADCSKRNVLNAPYSKGR